MNESYEMTFTLKDADMKKLFEIFEDININDCPYFEIQDKYGNSAKYYREKPPSAQPETHEKRTETHACDCISRQAAIDAIGILLEQSEDDEHDKTWNNAIRSSINAVKHHLPSVQPEQSDTSEFWRKRADYYSDMCSKLIADMGAGVKIEAVKIDETGITFTKKKPPTQQEINCSEIPNSSDTISRQLAIDVLDQIFGSIPMEQTTEILTFRRALRELPSAQPEPLTDKEQRIFLMAMEREEKVCEGVDRYYVREPYEDSLMRVCKEIRRKVKGALWT